jgi:hypothetical protein
MNTLAKRLATLGCALCAVATLARPSSSSAQFVPQNPGVNGTSTQTQDAVVGLAPGVEKRQSAPGVETALLRRNAAPKRILIWK